MYRYISKKVKNQNICSLAREHCIRLVLCYFYLRIGILSIYTPGFVLFGQGIVCYRQIYFTKGELGHNMPLLMLFGWPTCMVMLGFDNQKAAADDISRFVHADVSNIPNPRDQSPNDKSLCQGSDG